MKEIITYKKREIVAFFFLALLVAMQSLVLLHELEHFHSEESVVAEHCDLCERLHQKAFDDLMFTSQEFVTKNSIVVYYLQNTDFENNKLFLAQEIWFSRYNRPPPMS